MKRSAYSKGPLHTSYKHGFTKTKIYCAWVAMRDRCDNPNNRAYPYYGGRGISVCERWSDFRNFLADMGERPSPAHTLDRINNDGNYEPSNCRWATRKEQQNNRRGVHSVTYDGKTKSIAAWAEERGLRPDLLSYRLNHGWSVKAALETPNLGRGRRAALAHFWNLDKRAA